jgi:hypothetical protein
MKNFSLIILVVLSLSFVANKSIVECYDGSCVNQEIGKGGIR